MIRRILTCLISIGLASAALAQNEPEEGPTVFLDFGFAGELTAGGWSPVTAVVQSIDEPLSGFVELTYSAGSETVSHLAPFAVGAQDVASIPMVVHLPWWTESVTIAAFDERRGRIAEFDYRSNPGPNDARLPTANRVSGVVLSATPRLPAARAIEIATGPDDKPLELLPVNVTPDRLSPNRLAYANVEVLILDPTTLRAADPRSIEAILRWTASGGRTLLLADRPGGEWQQFLDATPATAQIKIASPETIHNGASARAITLDPLATRSGWTTIRPNGTPLAAEGPFAFGWLALITSDPLEPLMERAITKLLQRRAPETSDDLARSLQTTRNTWYDPLAARATDWLLYRYVDAVSSSAPPGAEGFVLIAVVPLALALLLGPVDYFFLGVIRRRPLAWLSALVWIAAVGSVAIVAPRLFQRGDADIGTVNTADLMLPNLALPQNGEDNRAAQIDSSYAGWSAGATVLFHASQAPFTLINEARDAWRPFEAGNSGSVAFSGIRFRQSPAGPGTANAASVTPLQIPARVWSITTLHREGPEPQTFAVALAKDGPRLTLNLTNAADPTNILAARVTLGDRVYRLTSQDGNSLTFESAMASIALETGDAEEQALAAYAVLAGEPDRRSPTINALVDAGWARIDLLTQGPGQAATFETPDSAARTTITLYRIVTPMPEPTP